ncbi:MAG: fibronectin type III domain-containing protein [Pseudomonadota bacterium]
MHKPNKQDFCFLIRSLFVVLGAFGTLSTVSHAGSWGSGNWGEIYWGTNPESAPTVAPTVAATQSESDEITVEFTPYPSGTGADGWRVVTEYVLSCSGLPSVSSSEPTAVLVNLEPDTEYLCSISAANDLGGSPIANNIVLTTEALSQGLSPAFLRAALCSSDNPPANC